MKMRGGESAGLRPKTCPPGCPKQKIIDRQAEEPFYCDIHVARPPSAACLNYNRKVRPKSDSDHCINRRPPGTKPIPHPPLGGDLDPEHTDTFLDTFDCQEQRWRSSSRRISSPLHCEHSLQPDFRPSVGQGKLTHDSFGDLADAQAKPWKSSVTYIPDGHECGKPAEWRASVRYIGDTNSKEKEWRSSVHCSDHLENGVEKPYRSQISIGHGAYTTDAETVQGPFKPKLRYIPEFYPDHPPWRPLRSHVCTRKCYHHHSNKSEHIYNPVPAFETKQKLPPRNMRTGNPLYNIEHPIRSRIYDVPAHDDPPDFPPQTDEEGQLLPRSGKKQIPWTVRSNPTYPDGRDRSRRRIIASGHIENLDSTYVCKKRESMRPTIRIVDGPQHHSVVERNVIAGPLEPGNNTKDRHLKIVSKPMAPHGTYNEDIIAGYFHRQKLQKEPLREQKLAQYTTEQRAQFTTCKPWLRQEIYNDTNEAYKENRGLHLVVHPAITRYLYEDRHAVVS